MTDFGEVPEWTKGAVSKTVVAVRSPWVRIPPSPEIDGKESRLPPDGGGQSGGSGKPNCRRGDRVAEGARLEIVCSAKRYRGFESLSLRHENFLFYCLF